MVYDAFKQRELTSAELAIELRTWDQFRDAAPDQIDYAVWLLEQGQQPWVAMGGHTAPPRGRVWSTRWAIDEARALVLTGDIRKIKFVIDTIDPPEVWRRFEVRRINAVRSGDGEGWEYNDLWNAGDVVLGTYNPNTIQKLIDAEFLGPDAASRVDTASTDDNDIEVYVRRDQRPLYLLVLMEEGVDPP